MEKTLADIGWSPPKDTKFRRRLLYLRHLVLYATVVRRGYPLQTLGNRSTGCSWTFCPQGLGSDSIVYSGGVGNDVTFEHGLVKSFGCKVCLLDPSPTGKNTMSLPENQIPEFEYLPLGLAGAAGTLRLAAPFHLGEGSYYSAIEGQAAVEMPCVDLKSLLERRHHRHVDLLKLDIEGAE